MGFKRNNNRVRRAQKISAAARPGIRSKEPPAAEILRVRALQKMKYQTDLDKGHGQVAKHHPNAQFERIVEEGNGVADEDKEQLEEGRRQ